MGEQPWRWRVQCKRSKARVIHGVDRHSIAVRRKFCELYRLPAPAHPTAPLSRTNSPTKSPSNTASPTALTNGHHPILSDPFTVMVIEMVKLVQAALALWGMFGTSRDDLEVDGLFCDETKVGIFHWRRVMGMEHEESMRLEVGPMCKYG